MKELNKKKDQCRELLHDLTLEDERNPRVQELIATLKKCRDEAEIFDCTTGHYSPVDIVNEAIGPEE